MAVARRGKRVPPVRVRRAVTQTLRRERAVRRAEAAFVGQWRSLASEAEAIILEWLRTEYARPGQDALGKDWSVVQRRIAALFADPTDWRGLFGRIAEQIDGDVLGVLLRTIPTIDRRTLVPAGRAQAWAGANADLIRGVSDLLKRQVAEFFAGAAQGEHVESLTEQLRSKFEIGEARARLWARDQTLKLHGEITRERHAAVGITRYIWTSSGDERVRPIHADLDGTEQRYDDPPVIREDGTRGHPGDDYQCRCTAYPVLD